MSCNKRDAWLMSAVLILYVTFLSLKFGQPSEKVTFNMILPMPDDRPKYPSEVVRYSKLYSVM